MATLEEERAAVAKIIKTLETLIVRGDGDPIGLKQAGAVLGYHHQAIKALDGRLYRLDREKLSAEEWAERMAFRTQAYERVRQISDEAFKKCLAGKEQDYLAFAEENFLRLMHELRSEFEQTGAKPPKPTELTGDEPTDDGWKPR